MIRAEYLEDLIIDAIGEYLVQNVDATEKLYNRSKEMLDSYKRSLAQLIENSDVDVEDKTRERSALVRALATAIGRVSDTTIQQMDSEIANLADDIAKSRARGQLAKDELNKLSGARLRIDSLRDNLSELSHRLERADLPTKKRLLSGLVSGIKVDPDKHHAIVHVRHFVFDHGIDLRLADDEFS